MQKCLKENCNWLKEYGRCASVCIDQGFARHISNYDQMKDMDIEQMAMTIAELMLQNDRTEKSTVQAVCLKMSFYDKCLRWLDKEANL